LSSGREKRSPETVNGALYGVLKWEQRDGQLRNSGQPWCFCAIGRGVPEMPLVGDDLYKAMSELVTLLRREHEEAYLGVVCVDDLPSPSLSSTFSTRLSQGSATADGSMSARNSVTDSGLTLRVREANSYP
jgi:hypothetical protein